MKSEIISNQMNKKNLLIAFFRLLLSNYFSLFVLFLNGLILIGILLFYAPAWTLQLEFKKRQPQLKRIKDKSYPNQPTNRHEIRESFQNEEIFWRFGHTLNKENKFYVNTMVTEDSSFCLFAS